jgi:hypothetical protein
MTGAVLSLFDYTTNMVRPWASAGYECWCVDIKHSPGVTRSGNVICVGADILHWTPPAREWLIAFGFPPCTHLASSGARWWKGKGLMALSESIALVARCAWLFDSLGCPWMIENPVGALRTHWREPDYKFDPCDYAGYLADPTPDAYTKRTCLWVGGGFTMPEPMPVVPILGSKMHLLPPSDDRAALRSETPRGFASAVFRANSRIMEAA